MQYQCRSPRLEQQCFDCRFLAIRCLRLFHWAHPLLLLACAGCCGLLRLRARVAAAAAVAVAGCSGLLRLLSAAPSGCQKEGGDASRDHWRTLSGTQSSFASPLCQAWQHAASDLPRFPPRAACLASPSLVCGEGRMRQTFSIVCSFCLPTTLPTATRLHPCCGSCYGSFKTVCIVWIRYHTVVERRVSCICVRCTHVPL